MHDGHDGAGRYGKSHQESPHARHAATLADGGDGIDDYCPRAAAGPLRTGGFWKRGGPPWGKRPGLRAGSRREAHETLSIERAGSVSDGFYWPFPSLTLPARCRFFSTGIGG